MIIRSKFQSNSQQKKRLSINRSKSNFSISNLKVPKEILERHRGSIFKSNISKYNQSNQTPDKSLNRELPSIQKQNIHRKKSISLTRKQIELDQKAKPSKGLKLTHINENKQSFNFNLPLIEQNSQNKENRKLKVDIKKNLLNNRLVISQYSSGKKNQNNRNSQDLSGSTDNSKENLNVSRRISNFKKYSSIHLPNKEERQLIDNSEQLQFNETNDNYFFNYSDLYQSRFQQLCIDTCVFQVYVSPTKKQKSVDVQVQTIQQEKQYFQYLRFKRKKQQYEEQISSIFNVVDFLRNDRVLYSQRISELLNNTNKGPQNQRQERVFNLRNQIQRHQKKVEDMIAFKYQSLEKYMKDFQKLEQSLATDNQKFLEGFLKYQKSLIPELQIQQSEKILKNYEKLEKIIKLYLKQSLKKIQTQLFKGKFYKEDGSQLRQAFQEYKRSVQEHKGLLRNCFIHIKKVPELCYGLLGDQLPKLDVRKEMRNNQNEFEMPKCMDCFNSEWKLHMIIEKNQLMQSIFKVTEELFK